MWSYIYDFIKLISSCPNNAQMSKTLIGYACFLGVLNEYYERILIKIILRRLFFNFNTKVWIGLSFEEKSILWFDLKKECMILDLTYNYKLFEIYYCILQVIVNDTYLSFSGRRYWVVEEQNQEITWPVTRSVQIPQTYQYSWTFNLELFFFKFCKIVG